MAQLVVRNIEDEVKDKLRDRAEQHGRSMEEEVRDILRAAVAETRETEPRELGTWIKEQFARAHLKQGETIREWRGHAARPATFE